MTPDHRRGKINGLDLIQRSVTTAQEKGPNFETMANAGGIGDFRVDVASMGQQ